MNTPQPKRHKSLDAVQAECKCLGWPVKLYSFPTGGHHVSIQFNTHGVRGRFILSSGSGRFWGQTSAGTNFDSDIRTHPDAAWFKSLVAAIYEPTAPLNADIKLTPEFA